MEGETVVLVVLSARELGANAKKAKAGSLARPRQVQLQLTIPPAYGLQELLPILTDFPRKGSARFLFAREASGPR
jgi:hypothetical protein